MKIRIIVFAVVFSAIGFGFSSNLQKAESAGFVRTNSKCAIPNFERAFEQSEAIFVGEVVSEEKSGDTKTFNFKVEKYWKGANKKNIEINVYETARFQAWFKTGERYLVYASANEKGKLNVYRCSRSKSIESAEDDLKRLGKGKAPR